MTLPEEYKLLERLVAKRRATNKGDDDLVKRMNVVWLELSDTEQRLVDPPPEPQPNPTSLQPTTPFFTNRPVAIKTSPPRPKAKGNGYAEF